MHVLCIFPGFEAELIINAPICQSSQYKISYHTGMQTIKCLLRSSTQVCGFKSHETDTEDCGIVTPSSGNSAAAFLSPGSEFGNFRKCQYICNIYLWVRVCVCACVYIWKANLEPRWCSMLPVSFVTLFSSSEPYCLHRNSVNVMHAYILLSIQEEQNVYRGILHWYWI